MRLLVEVGRGWLGVERGRNLEGWEGGWTDVFSRFEFFGSLVSFSLALLWTHPCLIVPLALLLVSSLILSLSLSLLSFELSLSLSPSHPNLCLPSLSLSPLVTPSWSLSPRS